jgi:hypothetical protein
VKPGQVYVFRRTEPGKPEVTYTWTVLEVHADGVYYKRRDPADAAPVRELWSYSEDDPGMRSFTRRGEPFRIGDVEFETEVLGVEAASTRLHTISVRRSNKSTFPGYIRFEHGDRLEEFVGLR